MLPVGAMVPGNPADTTTRLHEILLCMLRACNGDPSGAIFLTRDDSLVSILQFCHYVAFQSQQMRQHLII